MNNWLIILYGLVGLILVGCTPQNKSITNSKTNNKNLLVSLKDLLQKSNTSLYWENQIIKFDNDYLWELEDKVNSISLKHTAIINNHLLTILVSIDHAEDSFAFTMKDTKLKTKIYSTNLKTTSNAGGEIVKGKIQGNKRENTWLINFQLDIRVADLEPLVNLSVSEKVFKKLAEQKLHKVEDLKNHEHFYYYLDKPYEVFSISNQDQKALLIINGKHIPVNYNHHLEGWQHDELFGYYPNISQLATSFIISNPYLD